MTLRRWQDFEKCARLANHSPDGVIELMPVSDASLYAFKYVNGHPKNTLAGMLTVMAFGALGDVDTGLPVLLAEMTLTTAIRTAATSALVARYLARDNSRSMALIGNGKKNGILMIDFALDAQRSRGLSPEDAIYQALTSQSRAFC